MRINKVIVLSALVLPAMFIAPLFTSVSAQSNFQENVQERRQEFLDTRCQNVTSRIDNRIERYNENKVRHIDNYNKIKDKLSETGNNLEDKGYDVTELRNDLQTLDSKIKEFAQSYTTFVNTLNDSKSFACGESEGAFKDKVEESRAQLKDSRDLAKEIRDYIQDVIRPDLVDLREQIKAEN